MYSGVIFLFSMTLSYWSIKIFLNIYIFFSFSSSLKDICECRGKGHIAIFFNLFRQHGLFCVMTSLKGVIAIPARPRLRLRIRKMVSGKCIMLCSIVQSRLVKKKLVITWSQSVSHQSGNSYIGKLNWVAWMKQDTCCSIFTTFQTVS